MLAEISPLTSKPSFCRSKPILASTWSRVISCCVAWSISAGQVGLHCGHWQLSMRWKGQPFRGVLLFLLASWRLLSQHCRARESDVPLIWKSIQLLKERKIRQHKIQIDLYFLNECSLIVRFNSEVTGSLNHFKKVLKCISAERMQKMWCSS